MKCDHGCALTPNGPKCYCPNGFIFDGTKCVDFNECNVYGICDHNCINTIGSYKCSCNAGFTLSDNRCFRK